MKEKKNQVVLSQSKTYSTQKKRKESKWAIAFNPSVKMMRKTRMGHVKLCLSFKKKLQTFFWPPLTLKIDTILKKEKKKEKKKYRFKNKKQFGPQV